MEKFKTPVETAIQKVRNAKFAVGALTASAALPIITVAASAEETAGTSGGASLSSYSSQITSQFTNTANDIIPIIVGVLGAGLGVFAIFMGIRLAKKMFSTVSK